MMMGKKKRGGMDWIGFSDAVMRKGICRSQDWRCGAATCTYLPSET